MSNETVRELLGRLDDAGPSLSLLEAAREHADATPTNLEQQYYLLVRGLCELGLQTRSYAEIAETFQRVARFTLTTHPELYLRAAWYHAITSMLARSDDSSNTAYSWANLERLWYTVEAIANQEHNARYTVLTLSMVAECAHNAGNRQQAIDATERSLREYNTHASLRDEPQIRNRTAWNLMLIRAEYYAGPVLEAGDYRDLLYQPGDLLACLGAEPQPPSA